MLQERHPGIKLASVIDDRSLRGPTQTVIDATRTAMVFDRLAGLKNNVSKFVGLSTTDTGRESLSNALFDGSHIQVSQDANLVGMVYQSKRLR